MTAKWPLPFVLVFGVIATRAAGPTVTIDTTSPSGKVSPLFYGLMTEEINHAYDGGLYAELVRNRAFLDDAATAAHWSLVQAGGSTATMALDPQEPLNATIATSLRLNVTQASTGHAAGIANEGYWGIPVKPNTRYRASFYAKAAPGFTAPVAVEWAAYETPFEPWHARSRAEPPTPNFRAAIGDAAFMTQMEKLVNASDADAPVQITLTETGSLASTATALTLSADPQATNAIDTPERVVPVTSTVTGVKSGFTYTVPKHGIVVLTMQTR